MKYNIKKRSVVTIEKTISPGWAEFLAKRNVEINQIKPRCRVFLYYKLQLRPGTLHLACSLHGAEMRLETLKYPSCLKYVNTFLPSDLKNLRPTEANPARRRSFLVRQTIRLIVLIPIRRCRTFAPE